MNIDPVIQGRVRQLLGLRGAPSVDGIESVQPVVQIAGFPIDRQPQLESGDMIPRNFMASAICPAVAARYSCVQIRAPVGSVLWVRQIIIGSAQTNTGTFVGRTGPLTFGAFGDAHYNDARLPWMDLGFTELEVGYENAVALPGFFGSAYHWGSTTLQFNIDYILAYNAAALTGLTVARETVNLALHATFIGTTFPAQP